MDPALVIELLLLALRMVVLLTGPVLLTVLVVGLVIGALQSATQINEPALAFVPKMLAVFVVLALTGPLLLSQFTDYLRELIARIPALTS